MNIAAVNCYSIHSHSVYFEKPTTMTEKIKRMLEFLYAVDAVRTVWNYMVTVISYLQTLRRY